MKRAIELSDSILDKGAGAGLLGRIYAKKGDADGSQEHFENSRRLLRNARHANVGAALLNMEREWLKALLLTGECVKAKDVYRELKIDLSHSKLPLAIAESSKNRVNETLREQGDNCGLPRL